MAWTTLTVGNATAGNAILASDHAAAFTNLNMAPRGVLARSANITSAFTTSATHTSFQDVTNYSASTTYSANRILRVTVQVAPYPSGGVNNISYKIVRGSTDLTTFDIPQEAMATGFAHGMVLSHTFSGPSTGATETFKLQMRANATNTAVSNFASASAIGVLVVEDLGAQ